MQHITHIDSKELRAKRVHRTRRALRTRARLFGHAERPRLSVTISLQHVSAQIIDDSQGRTLASATTVNTKDTGKTLTDKARWVGAAVAKAAKQHKIKQVVFDRGAKKYHGRVAALAEAARQEGLEF